MNIQKKCSNCHFWEWEGYADDANYRYGRCTHAYDGYGEAYPRTEMVLKLNGPKHATDLVYAELLTGESFHCDDIQLKGDPS